MTRLKKVMVIAGMLMTMAANAFAATQADVTAPIKTNWVMARRAAVVEGINQLKDFAGEVVQYAVVEEGQVELADGIKGYRVVVIRK